jgi:hypothetical protein
MQNEASLLRRQLDMKQHFLESIKNHPWEWATAQPFSAGCCLAFLSVKRGSILTAPSEKPVKGRDKGCSASFGEKCGNIPNR